MHYVDTSALLKRYIREAGSEEFEAWFTDHAPLAITRLTLVETRSALARRRRRGEIDETIEHRAIDELRTDLQDGALLMHPTTDADVADAFHLIESLHPLPLRSLDAIQLSVARHIDATGFATSDKNQAEAARALGFDTRIFS